MKNKKKQKTLRSQRLCGGSNIKKSRENFHGLFETQKKGPWVWAAHGPLKIAQCDIPAITSLGQTRCNGFATTASN
jgi:hypothetical protein